MKPADLLTTPLSRMQRIAVAKSQWKQIATEILRGVPKSEIAARYKICKPTVGKILRAHKIKAPDWQHKRHDVPDPNGNKFQRGAYARQHADDIAKMYTRGVAIGKIAARYRVSGVFIFKLIGESKTPGRGHVGKIIPDAEGNQRQRTEFARQCISQIVESFKSGDSILNLARQYDVSSATISKLLAAAGASRKNKKHVTLTKDQVEARIAACRLPDVEFWQCSTCGRNFNGKIQPYQCPCGSIAFDYIKARRRLDLTKLDALDGIAPAAKSLVARKIHATQGACA